MSREQVAADLLKDDPELMAILTGGVYTDEEIGLEGIHRGADSPTNAAFDANGVLLPTAVVREGAEVAYAAIRDVPERVVGITQAIEIYFYQHRDRDQILLAKQRVYELLEGVRLGATYPLVWLGETPVFYDVGPVANSSTIRQDWRCVFMKRPAA